jgi:hypothetical protein
MADFFRKYRIKAGGVLLIVLTGYAVLSLLVQSIRIYADLPEKDPVTIHEARIAQLKGSLPPSGEVGYVTTVENDRIFAAENPLVVGNFLDGPPPPGFLDKNGLVPLKDFGDGLVLYRREIGR